jgi:hypothetical protein
MMDGVLRGVPDYDTLYALNLTDHNITRVYPTDKLSYTFGSTLPRIRGKRSKGRGRSKSRSNDENGAKGVDSPSVAERDDNRN